MTPAQLRAFSAVVRLGSVHAAARNSACPTPGSPCTSRSCARNSTTRCSPGPRPGWRSRRAGLRLASRAVEILGLQQQTAIEVTEAAHGRRLLRIAASSAFAEHAAPGLIELFSSRANDLSVELSVHPDEPVPRADQSRAPSTSRWARADDGPSDGVDRRAAVPEVPDPHRRRARQSAGRRPPTPALLREQQWMLGPSAGSVDGEIAAMLRNLAIPEVPTTDLPERRRRARGGAARRRCHPGDRLRGRQGPLRPDAWCTSRGRVCRRPASGAR